MKKLFVAFFAVILTSIFIASSACAGWLEATTRELQLVQDFSRCVDYGHVIVDKECLRSVLRRDFGLKPEEVRYGTFGSNASGKYFSMLVQKSSRSGGTVGLFDVTVYLEKYGAFSGKGLYLITFMAHGGGLYGAIPSDGLVNIYDNARGDYLVNDGEGRTINSMDLPDSALWSPKHTASNLINGGKTVGYILEERLESLERVNKGGASYTKRAEDNVRSSERSDSKHQFKVIFN